MSSSVTALTMKELCLQQRQRNGTNGTNGYSDAMNGNGVDEFLNEDLGTNGTSEPHESQLLAVSIGKLEHQEIGTRSNAMAVLAQQLSLGKDSLTSNNATALMKQLQKPSLLDLNNRGGNLPSFICLHTNLCSALIQLQAHYPTQLVSHFRPLAVYLVDCTVCHTRPVATAAAQYWAKLGVPPVPAEVMEGWAVGMLPVLNKLIPGLLNNLVLQKEHMEHLESNATTKPKELQKCTDLRNFSAMGLETICRIFPTESTTIFKPWLQRWMNGNNWLELEAIILALSAYTSAVGMTREMKDVFPEVIAQLLDCYSHPKPLVRAITCFTMQNFINIGGRRGKDPFTKMLKCTRRLLHDTNNEVKEMALHSLTAMLAYAERDVTPYAARIIDGLMKADSTLQGNSRHTYYECIGHLFGRMGSLLEEKDTERLMQPLMSHWAKINDSENTITDKEDIVMLCQPMCVVAMFAKGSFSAYNDRIMEKAVPLLEEVSTSTASVEPMKNTRAIAYLDLISAVFDGQRDALEELVKEHKLVEVTVDLLQNTNLRDDVHQSALALLGHLAQNYYKLFSDKLENLCKILTTFTASGSNGIQNNALWTLSHVATHAEVTEDNESMLDFSKQLMDVFEGGDQGTEQGTMINALLCLSTFATRIPDLYLNLLTSDGVFQESCYLLQTPFPRALEKVTILKNMCSVLQGKVRRIKRPGWVQFCVTAAMLDVRDEGVNSAIKNLLHGVREAFGNNGWNKISQELGNQLAYTLRKRYKLY